MIKGVLLYDFFLFPTIRIDRSNTYFNDGFTRITIEWMRWYVGFTVRSKNDCIKRK